MVVPHKQKLTRDTWSIGKTAATAEPSETQVQAGQVQPVGQASVLRPCKLGTNLMVSHGHRGYSRVLRRAARHGAPSAAALRDAVPDAKVGGSRPPRGWCRRTRFHSAWRDSAEKDASSPPPLFFF